MVSTPEIGSILDVYYMINVVASAHLFHACLLASTIVTILWSKF